jgi:hypothetical protein
VEVTVQFRAPVALPMKKEPLVPIRLGPRTGLDDVEKWGGILMKPDRHPVAYRYIDISIYRYID